MDKATLPGEDHPEARTKTIDNLKRIALAMACYARVNNGRFPPAAIRKDGTPLLSWRVAILPFLDVYLGARLFKTFRLDEPWDSAHNTALLEEMPAEYEPVDPQGVSARRTYYQGFVGPGSLFDGEEGTMIDDITDGVSWTLTIVEASEPVPWTKPADIGFDKAGPLPSLGGQFEDGFYVTFADGSVRFLSRKLPTETLCALIRRDDGEMIGFDRLGPWRRPQL